MTRDFPETPGLPPLLARYGNAPLLLETFQQLSERFDARTSLAPLEREVVVFAVARRNGCELCVAFHTMLLARGGTPPERLAELRGERAYADERLAALDAFTRSLLDHAGDVDRAAWARFLAAGFTRPQALEVVLGVGTYTLSTIANRLLEIPVDGPVRDFA
jgi:AhpD family alkylhydroperoxidase